jgi:hypothetical protein
MNLHESWYVHRATWSNINGVLHKSLWSIIPVSLPFKCYLNAWTNCHGTWYVYHANRAHFNCVRHKSLSSVMPTLQPFTFLRQNLNIAQTLVPIFMKLYLYIMTFEPIWMAYIINSFHQEYQHYSHSDRWGQTLIFLECLY